jgi:hypothetical protein
VEKYCRAGQATADNMVYVYKYTLRICNTYCFYTAKMVARTTYMYIACLFVVLRMRQKLDDAIGGENALSETIKIF